jgi:hypothetical protein
MVSGLSADIEAIENVKTETHASRRPDGAPQRNCAVAVAIVATAEQRRAVLACQ